MQVKESGCLPRMAGSRYRGVSWHKGIQRYVVQAKQRGKRLYKAFSTEQDAVAYLQRVTRISEARLLRRSGPAMQHWSSYRGVSWHRGNQKWVAQHGGKTLGAFKSQRECAAFLSRRLGVPLSSLKRPIKVPRLFALKRLHLLMPLFQHGLPGDLASAIQHQKCSKSMFVAEPVLEFVSIMSKYGPFKDKLFTAWRESAAVRQGVKGSAESAAVCQGVKRSHSHLLKIIGQACIAYSKLSSEEVEPWITHCGRNVSHHMGPLPICKRLGILVACSRASSHGIIMGKDTQPVRLASTFQEKAIASLRLQRISTFMQAINESRCQGGATTCRHWQTFTNAALSAMQAHKPPGITSGSGYSKLWFIRSLLIASGNSFRDPKATVEEFASTFPDSKQWLSLFPHKQTIKAAMAEVKYAGEPALFTMHLCMLGSKDMDFDIVWLQKHVEDIVAIRQSVEQGSGMSPTPGFCCLQVLRQGVKVSSKQP